MIPKKNAIGLIRKSAIALLAAGISSAAHGGVLPSNPVVTTVGGSPEVLAFTTAPNNFPTANTSNMVFVFGAFSGASSVDVVYQGVNSGGTTEYLFYVLTGNIASAALSSLTFQIGTGTGTAFVPLTGSSSFGFVSPPVATSTDFPIISLSSTNLTFSGGSEAVNDTDTETFAFAVPDQSATPFTFTLRETATVAAPVPEASSVASFGLLLAFGAGGLYLMARKRAAGAAK